MATQLLHRRFADLEMERLLWACIAMMCLHRSALDSFGAVVTLVHLWMVDTSKSGSLWRYAPPSTLSSKAAYMKDGNKNDEIMVNLVDGDRHGVSMSIALIPCVLLSGMDSAAVKAKQLRHREYYYSATIAILAVLQWSPNLREAFVVLLSAYGLQSFCRGSLYDSDGHLLLTDGTYMVLLIAIWWIIGSFLMASSLRRSLTRGEYFLVQSLASVAATELAVVGLYETKPNDIYAPTAAVGVMACAAACAMVDHVPLTNVSILWRFACLALATLGSVEVMFWVHGIDAYAFPRCLNWIFRDFLMQSETPAKQDGLPHWLIDMRRIGWLGYWGLVMIVTIPFAPGTKHTTHPVMARKWFHFIAILLFVPATMWAPQMQSLSYAVALCVLMIIETTRRHVGWLNDFYKVYLDHTKNEGEETTVVSHMALILGCATPLWLCQWHGDCGDDDDKITLPLWGVYVLGVGDSMAAMFGKAFGRHQWMLHQRRTMEGSLAMALSLGIILYYNQPVQRGRILPAILLSTLLEAFTFQIDNLVLPLVGYAIIVSS